MSDAAAMRAAWTDLRERCKNRRVGLADQLLYDFHDPGESRRLQGKSEGVALVLDYMRSYDDVFAEPTTQNEEK